MEPYAKMPLWLELSGLPVAMNEAVKLQAAWPVFCKIVAVDCQRNPSVPSHIALSLRDLGAACGISSGAAERIVLSLRKKGWIACFVPDNDEEDALFQVKIPLPTPLTPDQVKSAHPALFPDPQKPLRYETDAQGGESEESADDPDLRQVIDLYFNTISMKMNSFILDELRLIRQRFSIPLIRRIFFRAKNHGITSMGWVLRELHRETAKALKKEIEEADEEGGKEATS